MRKFTVTEFEYTDFGRPEFDDTNHPGYGEYYNTAVLHVTVRDENGKTYKLISDTVYVIVETRDYYYFSHQTYRDPEEEGWDEAGIYLDEDYADEFFFSEGLDGSGNALGETELPTEEETEDILRQLDGGYIDYRKSRSTAKRSLV